MKKFLTICFISILFTISINAMQQLEPKTEAQETAAIDVLDDLITKERKRKHRLLKINNRLKKLQEEQSVCPCDFCVLW